MEEIKLKKDVCLISPPGRAQEPRLPLSLMYLQSWLQKLSIEASIIDIKTNPFQPLTRQKKRVESEILRKIEEINPNIVGITCLTQELKDLVSLSREIKQRVETTIVMGGIHPSLYPEDILYSGSPVDFVVIGEGETTFSELVQAVLGGRDIEGVDGLAFLREGQVIRTTPRKLIENLDEIPWPIYDRVDMAYYTAPHIYTVRPVFLSALHIFTSRGCPYKCTFCANKNISGIYGPGKKIRYRSIEDVVNEIEYLHRRYKIDGFYLYDDTFGVDRKRAIKFCENLMNRRMDIIWGAETRVNLISEELIRAMKGSGCIQLDLGVESGSQEILDRIKKGITIEQARNAFDLCGKYGIRTWANFMFNLPSETESDVQASLRLAEDIHANAYNFNICAPYPGTDLYELVQPPLKVEEYGLYNDCLNNIPDRRFRFAKHDLDISQTVQQARARFNTPFKRISFLSKGSYLRKIARSKRKSSYFKRFPHIFRAFLRILLK